MKNLNYSRGITYCSELELPELFEFVHGVQIVLVKVGQVFSQVQIAQPLFDFVKLLILYFCMFIK